MTTDYFVDSQGWIQSGERLSRAQKAQRLGPYSAWSVARAASQATVAGTAPPSGHGTPAGIPRPTQPVTGAVPKESALYALIGLFLPGMPSLLLRDEKVLGIVQILAGIVAVILTIVVIGLIAYPGVCIWSAVTGYRDAQLWNRRTGS